MPCNGQNSYETVATAVRESRNLVLLSVAVEATCFENVLPVARCVTRLNVFNHLSCRFRGDCGTTCSATGDPNIISAVQINVLLLTCVPVSF